MQLNLSINYSCLVNNNQFYNLIKSETLFTISFPGALFAILASLESLCNFSSQLIFNPLYTWTVTELTGEFVAGITFFINAGLLLIPVVLIG